MTLGLRTKQSEVVHMMRLDLRTRLNGIDSNYPFLRYEKLSFETHIQKSITDSNWLG